MSTKSSAPRAQRARGAAALVLAGVTLGAGLAMGPTSAQAVTMPLVKASGCGSFTITPRTYTGRNPVNVYVDAGFYDGPFTSRSANVTEKGLPGGSYTYLVYDTVTHANIGGGVVHLATCSGKRTRTAEGDANGDGVADVFGVTTGGALIYYRMESTGLKTVKTVFSSGFATTRFIQRVSEVAPDGTAGIDGRNYLFAIRSDGTMWRYPDNGNGSIGSGVRIATGLTGYDHFTITQANSPQAFGNHMLLATKGGELYGFVGLGNSSLGAAVRISDNTGDWADLDRQISLAAFDHNGFADMATIWDGGDMFVDLGGPGGFGAGTQIGHAWGAMQIVSSPGDLNRDGLSDLVARRSDGNLYRYTNTGKGWASAVQIGRNWGGITCLG